MKIHYQLEAKISQESTKNPIVPLEILFLGNTSSNVEIYQIDSDNVIFLTLTLPLTLYIFLHPIMIYVNYIFIVNRI